LARRRTLAFSDTSLKNNSQELAVPGSFAIVIATRGLGPRGSNLVAAKCSIVEIDSSRKARLAMTAPN
jgi:hypothetical protein